MKCSLKFSLFLSIMLFAFVSLSCSHEEDVRMPEDIMGVWSPSSTRYLEFSEGYTVHNLDIEYQDGESIGLWTVDAYLYEPGYHLVIYLTGNKADVFQIISLDSSQMTWCWVEQIEFDESMSKENIGKILGNIIKEAQEGFHLDPEHYQSFKKISEDDFFSILESLNIMYPW